MTSITFGNKTRRSAFLTLLLLVVCIYLLPLLDRTWKGQASVPMADDHFRIAVVQSYSQDRAQFYESENFLALRERWKQYAQMHNYNYFLFVLPAKPIHFCSYRWHYLASRTDIWISHDAILHCDMDTAVIDINRPLSNFLTHSAEMVMPIRDTIEVSASTILMKTSSFSRSFLMELAAMGKEEMSNYDNGDLLQLLMNYVDPSLAAECSNHRTSQVLLPYIHNTTLHHYHWKKNATAYTKCFGRLLPVFALNKPLPFKLYAPFSGFWRPLEGVQDPRLSGVSHRDSLFHACWSNDFIVHGWKNMGVLFHGNNTGNKPLCPVLSPGLELQVAMDCCLTSYPGCQNAWRNVCSEQAHCREVGFGRVLHSCQWESS